ACVVSEPSVAAGDRCIGHSSARPRAPGRRVARGAGMRLGSTRRAPAIGPALPLFSERLLQDRLVECQVGDDLLQLAILLAELAQLADLGGAEIAEPLLPPVVGLLADPVLAAQLNHRHAAVPLPEDVHHLLRRELARPHRARPPSGWGP